MVKIYSKLKSVGKSVQRIWGKKTQIGNYILEVDPENSQPYILKKHAEHGMNLVRLARLLNTKYAPLQIFDIGANFGDTAAMLLTDDPHYTVICIEGDKPTFRLLKNNFGQNAQVRLHNIFLGEKSGPKTVSPSKLGGSLELNDKGAMRHETVEIVNLDAFIATNPAYNKVKLLKIDTDGYDNAIMRGAKKYLGVTRPAILFEYDKKCLDDNDEKGVDIFDFLEAEGYEDLLFYDNVGRFIISVSVKDKATLKQLDRYISKRQGAYAYYDIIAFHMVDKDIAASFIRGEESRTL